MAEPQARGDNAASVVDTVSVAWQARDGVTWLASAAAKTWALAEPVSQAGQTLWYKVLELNVAAMSGVKLVCTFPIPTMFSIGKGLHRSWSYQMYHEEEGRSVRYGLRVLQSVGVDDVRSPS